MKKPYNYYKDILENNGYKNVEYEVVGGVVASVDFVNDKNFLVSLGVQPTDEYDAELMSLPNNTEYTPDYNRMECHWAFFDCCICNVKGYMDGSKNGIIIKAEEGDRYALLDAFGEEYQNYYPHKMELFEKCLWIQNHISEHEEFILQRHLDNLKIIRNEYNPVLEELDFYQSYSSFFDCTEVNSDKREDSNPLIEYTHRADEMKFSISTDCITGDLLIGNVTKDDRNIKDFIIDGFMKYKGEIKTEYRYLFDKDYKRESGCEIYNAMQILNYNPTLKRLKDIDQSLIPAKDYQHLLDEINNKIKELSGNV